MGYSVEFAQFALRTTNGTTDITVSGAGTCKGAVFFLSGGLVNGTVRNPMKMCVGWIDSSGVEAVGYTAVAQDAVGTMNTSGSWSSVNAIAVHTDDASAIDGVYLHSAFIDSGGVHGIQITTSNPAAQAHLVTAMLFFGTDATLVDFSITPSPGTVDVETLVNIGQDSDCIIWSHLDNTRATDTIGIHAFQNLAVSTWDGTTIRQRGRRVFSQDAVGDTVIKQFTGPRLDVNFSSGTSINRGMECTTMDGDEVGITSRENDAPTDRPYRGVSINLNGAGEARVELLEIPTSGNLSSTAYGFKPQAMLFGFTDVLTQVDETGSFETGRDNLSLIGVMDGTSEFCVSAYDEDAAATSNTTSVAANNVLLGTNASDTVIIDGDFSTFDAAGFTVTMVTNPGQVWAGFGLAFEQFVAAGTRNRAMVCS